MAEEELRTDMAQLCSLAGAEEAEGSLLLGSVQGYMEQASKTVQDALNSVHESDIAAATRCARWPSFLCLLLSCPGAETLAQRLWPTKFTRSRGLSELLAPHCWVL